MKVATWNVNSLRARHDLVIDWLKRRMPDVLCLQETKVEDDDFPTEDFHRLGYSVVMAGQKSYNGVAIATRLPLSDVRIGLPSAKPEDDKRLISAVIEEARIYCAYAPNGKSISSPHFPQKLEWFRELRATLDQLPAPHGGTLVCGDFNIAPEERDVFDVESMRGQLHFHPAEHAVLAELKAAGLTDAFRLHNQEPGNFTWWDYRAGSFRKNQGLRIDYLLVSPELARRCNHVMIDKEERGRDKPSDHCPVIAEFV
jgi:exodeoxyribonuclease-3